jgi:hypothetical protein
MAAEENGSAAAAALWQLKISRMATFLQLPPAAGGQP